MQSDHSPSEAPSRDVIVLRVAEIFLKGRNRKVFIGQFVKNARRLVADLEGVEVEKLYLRWLVHHPRELRDKVIERLSGLFGLSSMSPAVTTEPNLDAIGKVALESVADIPAGETFKVETNRRDKQFPMTSQAVSSEIGGRVFMATDLPVDVKNPQHVINIEIGEERTFVYREVVRGPGGLPVGTAGKVTLLLSGGIDSPVAGWSMLRRGCTLDAVYFHSFPYTGDKTKEKVLDIGRQLARWQGKMSVNVVHFTEVQKQLRDHGPGELAVLLYRRMMMRTAAKIAQRTHSKALVTGENLGQVASQTLANLGVIQVASPLPVLRPLLAYDKAEIIERAQSIGTFETSILPYDDACSLFVPKYPATKATVRELEKAEHGLDVDALAQSLADGAERFIVE
jgi:thiamine biosynthesis protein ThiI